MSPEFVAADARNRAWRTVLQGLAATVILAALTAAAGVLQVAVGSQEAVDWSAVAGNAGSAAGVAALMALLSYAHRIFGDQLPSAPA